MSKHIQQADKRRMRKKEYVFYQSLSASGAMEK